MSNTAEIRLLKVFASTAPISGIKQADLPGATACHNFKLLLAGLRRVKARRRHAVGLQLISSRSDGY